MAQIINENELKVVRLQIVDEITGEPLDYVNVRTNAKSINLSDGTFLEDVINSLSTKINKLQVSEAKTDALLQEHLNSDLHVSHEKIMGSIIDIDINEDTGIITFTRYDGTPIVWDTALEQIPLDFDFDKKTNEMVFVKADGNEVRVNLSRLADLYEGSESNTTKTNVSPIDNTISVDIREAAVRYEHLSEEVKEFLIKSKEFIDKYADKLEGIEEGANKYVLPSAKDGVLGGIKPGAGITITEDGTASATNITYGETKASATPVGLFLEVVSVGGSSTDPIPTVEAGKSYITSEGNIIRYQSDTDTYDYSNSTTDGTIEANLTLDNANEKMFNGLELIDKDTITWYHDETNNYAVTSTGDGFIYELSSWIFVGYLDTEGFITLVNLGTLEEGLSPNLLE